MVLPGILAHGRWRWEDQEDFKVLLSYVVCSGQPGLHKSLFQVGHWWCTPLVLALGRQRQVDLLSSRSAWST